MSWAGEAIRGPTRTQVYGLNCTAAPRRAAKLPRSHATGRPGDPSQRDTPRRCWGAPRTPPRALPGAPGAAPGRRSGRQGATCQWDHQLAVHKPGPSKVGFLGSRMHGGMVVSAS